MSQGFSGVGIVGLFKRTAPGLKGLGRQMGNCPKLSVKMDPQSVERNESMTTARGPLRRMTQATKGTIELVCDEFNKRNFAQFIRGRVDEVAADTATTKNHEFPTGAVVGDVLALPTQNVNTVVITDDSGTPKTLPPAAYDADLFAGTFRLLDLTAGGPYVQPFTAAYKQGAVSVIAGLAVPDEELWLGMAGTNADTGQRGVFDAYRVRFDPAQTIEYINNDYQDFTLSGAVLLDTTKPVSAVGGQVFSFAIPADHE